MMPKYLNYSNFSIKTAVALFLLAIVGVPAGAVDLTLGWDENTENDLEGYAIYKNIGSVPTDKNLDGHVAVRDLINPSYPAYTITGLQPGARYYLAIKAYNTAGTYSAFSDALCVQVGDTIGLCSESTGGDATEGGSGGGDTGGGSSGGSGSGGGGGGNGSGCFISSAGENPSFGAWGAGIATLIIGGLMTVSLSQKQE